MGFGPFLSNEDKAEINAARKRTQGLVSGGPGEMITPAERARRIQAASPEGMGLVQPGQGVGFGPFVSPAQKQRINQATRETLGGPYGPGGAPDGSGRGQAQQRQVSAKTTPSYVPGQGMKDNFMSDADYVTPKGQFRGMGQRQKADGKGGWTDVNVVHNSQPAVLNGQNVRADGKGNWIDMNGKAVGTYKVGQDRSPAPVKPPVETKNKPPVETLNKPEVPPETKLESDTPREQTTKTNALGVEQTGTGMSSTLGDFNSMYERVVGKHNMSATAYNPFESVHLHGSGDSREDMVNGGKNSYTQGEAAAFNSGQGIEWSSDQKADAPYTIAKPADLAGVEGAPRIVQSGVQKVVKGVNGHDFGGEHEAPATIERDRTSQLRRKWMMGDMKNADGSDMNSMQRLRGMRSEQGFDMQGTKAYALGSLDPANKSGVTEISQDQYRKAVGSDAGAREVATSLKDAYVAKVSDTPEVPAPKPVVPTQSDMEDFGSSIAQQYLKNKKPIK